jgi:broad specificity phosphatase PhoE
MELYVVRHGQTRANETNTIQGQGNTPLNPLGIRQAECVAVRLRTVVFDAVYSSDLDRAMETARRIAPYRPPAPCPQLREWHLGDLEGRSREDVEKDFAEAWNGFLTDRPEVAIPGGENKAAVRRRVGDFLEQLAARHVQDTVLVVSHCGAIRVMFKHILGMSGCLPRQPQIGNASISRMTHVNGVWQLGCWNDTAHLAGLESKQGGY